MRYGHVTGTGSLLVLSFSLVPVYCYVISRVHSGSETANVSL